MSHDIRRNEGAVGGRRSECSIPEEYVPHICIKLGHYLTSGLDHAVAEAEGPGEILRIVLELSYNIPDKASLLDKCGAFFLWSLHSKN